MTSVPDATRGERIVADWSDSEDVRVTSALLRDLARRIDEDWAERRAALLETALRAARRRDIGGGCWCETPTIELDGHVRHEDVYWRRSGT